jgi:hypothetical protein
MPDEVQPTDNVPFEVITFCDLLARILYRCLKNQTTRTIMHPIGSDHNTAFGKEGRKESFLTA